MKVFVLDSTVFYSGADLPPDSVAYVTSMILEEVGHKDRLEALMASGKVRVLDPDERYVERARELARGTGDLLKLSEADLSIVALSLELKERGVEFSVVSDDSSVRNLLERVGVKTEGVEFELRFLADWIKYCPACGRVYGPEKEYCEVCGTKLKVKARRKKLFKG